MNLNERAEMAVQRKNSGKYNCAQAVTTALADQTGLQEEQMKQISAGFCAGMGNMQATCGALIGAGMIAGLKTEGKGTLKVTRQIQEAFREACGAITCRDLKAFLFPLSGSFPKKIGWRNLTFCINRTRIQIENIAFCKKC